MNSARAYLWYLQAHWRMFHHKVHMVQSTPPLAQGIALQNDPTREWHWSKSPTFPTRALFILAVIMLTCQCTNDSSVSPFVNHHHKPRYYWQLPYCATVMTITFSILVVKWWLASLQIIFQYHLLSIITHPEIFCKMYISLGILSGSKGGQTPAPYCALCSSANKNTFHPCSLMVACCLRMIFQYHLLPIITNPEIIDKI